MSKSKQANSKQKHNGESAVSKILKWAAESKTNTGRRYTGGLFY